MCFVLHRYVWLTFRRISVYLRWGHIPTCDFHLCNGLRIRTETFTYHSWNSRTNTFFYPTICLKIIFLWSVCVCERCYKEERFPFIRVSILIHRYLSWLVVRKRYTNTFHHLCTHATVKTCFLYICTQIDCSNIELFWSNRNLFVYCDLQYTKLW